MRGGGKNLMSEVEKFAWRFLIVEGTVDGSWRSLIEI
jgi:hypothetical protein